MKPTLVPYLNFNGKTHEAMEFYQSVLGGELKMQTMGELGAPCDPQDKDKIMHADLKNDALSFMASDGDAHHPVQMGDNIKMSIVDQMKQYLLSISMDWQKAARSICLWLNNSGAIPLACSPINSASTGWSTSTPEHTNNGTLLAFETGINLYSSNVYEKID